MAKAYEIGAQWHAGTFNISSAKNREKSKAVVAGSPGKREIHIYETKKRFFRKPERTLKQKYKVLPGDKKNAVFLSKYYG